jgi:hypothetical protein
LLILNELIDKIYPRGVGNSFDLLFTFFQRLRVLGFDAVYINSSRNHEIICNAKLLARREIRKRRLYEIKIGLSVIVDEWLARPCGLGSRWPQE